MCGMGREGKDWDLAHARKRRKRGVSMREVWKDVLIINPFAAKLHRLNAKGN
jgi:hypothetical protein